MEAGDIINWYGVKYRVEKAKDMENPCEGCAFNGSVCNCSNTPMCFSSEDRDLIFVELKEDDHA